MPKKKTKIDISTPKSYISLVYGAITVILIFLVLFFGIRSISQRNASITPEAQETAAENQYIVKEGDTLWSIAEKEYKDGFKWTEISKANKLSSPGQIEKGMKLVIPILEEVASVTPTTVTPMQEVEKQKITSESYKVIEGDNLWDICVRAYGDGYKWVEIAKANKIANPDLIYPGDQIKLPR